MDEDWTIKKAEHRKLMFLNCGVEKTLESPLDCKEIQPVHPKGDQSWVFIGRTDGEADTPILWPPDAESWLIWKDPDAGKDWGQEEKGTAEDEMVGWHHLLNGNGFGWTLGVGDMQGGLACCGSWGHKESDTTESLNSTEELLCSLSLVCIMKFHDLYALCVFVYVYVFLIGKLVAHLTLSFTYVILQTYLYFAHRTCHLVYLFITHIIFVSVSLSFRQ